MAADLSVASIRACVDAYWAIKTGAASPGGWAVVLAFSLASAAAGFVALRGRRKADRILWAAMGAILAGLAANAQLDLLGGMTEIGRCFARLDGWYGARRALQGHLMTGLWATCAVVAFLLWRLRRGLRSAMAALAGFALILATTGVRAVSLHHMDSLINFTFAGATAGAWAELLGASLIIGNAIWLLALITGRISPRSRCGRGSDALNPAIDLSGHN